MAGLTQMGSVDRSRSKGRGQHPAAAALGPPGGELETPGDPGATCRAPAPNARSWCMKHHKAAPKKMQTKG